MALANYFMAVSDPKRTTARVSHISGNQLVLRHAQATALSGRRKHRESGRPEPPLPPLRPQHHQPPLRRTRSVHLRAWASLATSTFWEVPRERIAIFWRALDVIVEDVNVPR